MKVEIRSVFFPKKKKKHLSLLVDLEQRHQLGILHINLTLTDIYYSKSVFYSVFSINLDLHPLNRRTVCNYESHLKEIKRGTLCHTHTADFLIMNIVTTLLNGKKRLSSLLSTIAAMLNL